MNTDDFIARAKIRCPDIEIIDQSVQEIDCSDKILVRCLKCGHEWIHNAKDFIRNKRRTSILCPECRKAARWENSKKRFEEKLSQINPNVKLIGEYRCISYSTDFECLRCGYKWKTQPAQLVTTTPSDCPKCSQKKRKIKNRGRNRTHEDYVVLVSQYNDKIRIIGTYIGANEPIEAECLICGHKWTVTANSLIRTDKRRSGCPKCSHTGKKHFKTHDEFVKEMAELHPNIEVTSQYTKMNEPITIRCKICGWKDTIDKAFLVRNRLSPCPRCGEKQRKALRKTTEEFVDEIAEIRNDIIIVGEYQGARERIKVECSKCGYEWEPVAHYVKNKNLSRCPVCSKNKVIGRSLYDLYIFFTLQRILGKGKVLFRDKTAIGKELDVYIPNMKAAIEIGSWLWHASNVERDKEKQIACNDCAIQLITIFTDVPNDEHKTDSQNVWYYPPQNKHHLDENICSIAKRVLRSLNIGNNLEQKDWDDIYNKAREHSVMSREETFVAKLSTVRPDLSYIGPYNGSLENVMIECNYCHEQFEKIPCSLFRGTKCPNCRFKPPADPDQQ